MSFKKGRGTMRREVRERLIVRLRKVLSETKSRVRIGKKMEEFLDNKRSKARMPVEPDAV